MEGVCIISLFKAGDIYFFPLFLFISSEFIIEGDTERAGSPHIMIAQTLLHAGVKQELSHWESEILKRLCENRNQVVNTQDVLIIKLRHKLAQDEQIRIVNVRGIGY